MLCIYHSINKNVKNLDTPTNILYDLIWSYVAITKCVKISWTFFYQTSHNSQNNWKNNQKMYMIGISLYKHSLFLLIFNHKLCNAENSRMVPKSLSRVLFNKKIFKWSIVQMRFQAMYYECLIIFNWFTLWYSMLKLPNI